MEVFERMFVMIFDQAGTLVHRVVATVANLTLLSVYIAFVIRLVRVLV